MDFKLLLGLYSVHSQGAKYFQIFTTFVQTTTDELEAFVSTVGDVKYMRLGGVDDAGTVSALVELANQLDIPAALQLHSQALNGNQIKYEM